MNDVSFFAPASLSNQGISVTENSIELQFIGEPIKFILQQGRYRFEAYGASGGAGTNQLTSAKKTDGSGCIDQNLVIQYQGNADCQLVPSTSGAGGYAAGTIEFKHPVKMYVRVGGAGTFGSPNAVGGYNGGGSSRDSLETGCVSGSGGGATDLRFEQNTLFHRVLVAGAGGGTDDIGSSDGFGGSGGGLITQGFWVSNQLRSQYAVTQTTGFSFGYGESASISGSKHPNGSKENSGYDDIGGAGAGWFGGFASHDNNGGAGGGSSFILTEDATYPEDEIIVYNGEYEEIERGYYQFIRQNKYIFHEPYFAEGIWRGNGQLRITPLKLNPINQFDCQVRIITFKSYQFFFTIFLIQ